MNISLFGGGRNDHLFTQYIFHLTIYYKNNTSLIIEETTNEKYINIFSFKNNIIFNDIDMYELNITIISFNTLTYNIKNKITTDDIYLYKDNQIYIEITKNKDNYANCCIHLRFDNSRLFFTPPNY